MWAAQRGKTDCLSALIQAKANVDHQDNVRWSAAIAEFGRGLFTRAPYVIFMITLSDVAR